MILLENSNWLYDFFNERGVFNIFVTLICYTFKLVDIFFVIYFIIDIIIMGLVNDMHNSYSIVGKSSLYLVKLCRYQQIHIKDAATRRFEWPG